MSSSYRIRNAEKKDLDEIVNLIVRLKKLNEEFDPLYTVREEVAEVARDYIEKSLERDDVFILVAESGGRIVGVIRVEIRSRIFYQPVFEGIITDLYTLPSFRDKGIGTALLDEAIKILRSRGISIIGAEFPPMNKIAVEFYEKRGFKPLLYTYFKEI
ncbi:MAG: GNAT family N-acetyltransferase [Sulfolobales archaeon]